ncbi:pyruvate ferredoxin/flavodoxin oxidoreductase [Bordetella pertussis]|nr:pyruvate ferredoxin/flavodoxin oxidoreductase [Bordetella pertussis]
MDGTSAVDPHIDLDYQLGDNLTRTSGRVFLTGTQALVRMMLTQRRLDRDRGLNPAGFVSGYRGSPLGGVDMAMWKAGQALADNQVSFLPSINEDMAATAVMGTQQAGVRTDRKVDGVFAMWYGKGPGVDRAGDALHHGRLAPWRRAGGGRRRPYRRFLVHPACQRGIADRLAHAHRAPGVHQRIRDLRAMGLGAVALQRRMGRVQGGVGNRGMRPVVRARAAGRLRDARRPGTARRTTGIHRARLSVAGGRTAHAPPAARGARVRAPPFAGPAGLRGPARHARHRHGGQGAPGHHGGPASAGPGHRRRPGAGAHLQARPDLAAGRTAPDRIRARPAAHPGHRGKRRGRRKPDQGPAVQPAATPQRGRQDRAGWRRADSGRRAIAAVAAGRPAGRVAAPRGPYAGRRRARSVRVSGAAFQ